MRPVRKWKICFLSYEIWWIWLHVAERITDILYFGGNPVQKGNSDVETVRLFTTSPLSTTFLMIGIAHPSIVLLIIREGPAEMGLRYMILKVSFVLSGALKKAVKYIKMNISDI